MKWITMSDQYIPPIVKEAHINGNLIPNSIIARCAEAILLLTEG